MAFFNRSSPALVEILNKLQSGGNPVDTDQNLYESGSIRYNIQASASDPQSIYLSVSIPPISPQALQSRCLPDHTVKDIERLYSNFMEVVRPPKEEFLITLRIKVAKLPTRKEDCIKAIAEISSIQAVILSSQLKDILWNLGSQDMTNDARQPIKLVYHPREPFFVVRMPQTMTAIFPMRFKDNTDVVLATSFFQELMEVGDKASSAKAPRFTWSPIPPSELRGESFQDLTTNGGFASFDILAHHVNDAKINKTVWILLNFCAYVKYHVKCTRGFLQRKVRQRMESLAEMLQQARTGGNEDSKKLKGHRRGKKLIRFSKPKFLKGKYGALTNEIQKIRSRIRIKAFERFRRRWFRFPKCNSFKKYKKLE